MCSVLFIIYLHFTYFFEFPTLSIFSYISTGRGIKNDINIIHSLNSSQRFLFFHKNSLILINYIKLTAFVLQTMCFPVLVLTTHSLSPSPSHHTTLTLRFLPWSKKMSFIFLHHVHPFVSYFFCARHHHPRHIP